MFWVQTKRKNFLHKILSQKFFFWFGSETYVIIVFMPSTFKPTRPLVKMSASYVEHSLLDFWKELGERKKAPKPWWYPFWKNQKINFHFRLLCFSMWSEMKYSLRNALIAQ